uniref:Uncharacterized protein n=1 Tax=Amphimedon queenslandica TaxID=400682 RepID=A0A1X7UPL5_AMPQE
SGERVSRLLTSSSAVQATQQLIPHFLCKENKNDGISCTLTRITHSL